MKKKITRKQTTSRRTSRKRKEHVAIHLDIQEKRATIPTNTLFKIASRVFLTIAILCFVIFFNLLLIRTFPVPKRDVLGATDKKYPQPTEIIIRDVGIDIPIYPAQITHGTYETSTLGASYLASSPIPGQTGNSIIYAHN